MKTYLLALVIAAVTVTPATRAESTTPASTTSTPAAAYVVIDRDTVLARAAAYRRTSDLYYGMAAVYGLDSIPGRMLFAISRYLKGAADVWDGLLQEFGVAADGTPIGTAHTLPVKAETKVAN